MLRPRLVGAGVFAAALAIFEQADRWPIGSPTNNALSFPGLVATFLGFFFFWLAGRSLLRAATGWAGEASDTDEAGRRS